MSWSKQITLGVSCHEDGMGETRHTFSVRDGSGVVMIGREGNPRTMLVIRNGGINYDHARIDVYESRKIELSAVNSAVFVDGMPVVSSTLSVGDEFKVGNTYVRLISVLTDASAPSATGGPTRSAWSMSPGKALVVATAMSLAREISSRLRRSVAGLVREARRIEKEELRGNPR